MWSNLLVTSAVKVLAEVEQECLNMAAARIPPDKPKTNDVTLIPGMVLADAFIRSARGILGAGGSSGSAANRLNRGFGRLCGKDIS
ncbi:hypothetical protein INT44_003804 [Umbelopsis vinacea]|uniref:Uncharacterized protein n=1 Tax=Umbelopsis vinacea TaxID=44442 RepID=A0A8H7PUZ5_9FUNG|nr:hypothetical protein INT44_003804 [Umbelopsis vinacea]